jgi:hypothetical protein
MDNVATQYDRLKRHCEIEIERLEKEKRYKLKYIDDINDQIHELKTVKGNYETIITKLKHERGNNV